MAARKRENQVAEAPPDGGWGWVVALAGFMILACTFGVIRSVGVFFVPWAEQFPEANAGEIALVQSILAGMTSLAAPVASALGWRFGFRPVIMAGGVIAAVGFALSWFASQLFHLYITIGCIAGFGGSLCLTNISTCVGRYFTTNRHRANSLITLGSGIASFACPPLFQFLLDEYGIRGAPVIVGGIALHMTAFGALVRPILLTTDVKVEVNANGKKLSGVKQSPSLLTSLLTDHDTGNVSLEAKDRKTYQQTETCLSFVNCTLLREIPFAFYLISVGLVASNYLVSNIYLAPRAKTFGVEEYESAFLLSIMAITTIVGRIIVGILPTWNKFKCVDQYATVASLLGLTMLFMPLATTYATMVAYSAIFGLFSGAVIPLILTATADLVEADSLPSAFGYSMFVQGLTSLVGPPVSGALRDRTGGFDVTFVFGGAWVLVGGLVPFLLHLHVFDSTREQFVSNMSPSDVVKHQPLKEDDSIQDIHKSYVEAGKISYVVVRETSL